MRAAALRSKLSFDARWAFGWPACLTAGAACLALVALAGAEAGHSWGSESGLYMGLAGAAFASYVLGLVLLRRTQVRLPVILALAAAIQLAPLAQPLLLSKDAYVYWDYGRIAAFHGGNPYRDPPSRFRSDPAYRVVDGAWRDRTSVYGPLFTFVSEGSAHAVGSSPDAGAWFYKALAALSVLAAAALAAAVSSRPAFAAAAVGWSPLFAIHFGGGGHNDAFAVALLLGALALEKRGRRQLAGALWACASAVKWIPLLLLPVRCARTRPRFGYPGFAGGAAIVAIAATALYGTSWLDALGPLVQNASKGSRASPVRALGGALGSREAAIAVALALFALAYLLLVRRARRGRARLGLTAAALLVATPWLLPWYAIWALPLAAAEDDSAVLVFSIALTGYLLEPIMWI